jgi:hypothetical protein
MRALAVAVLVILAAKVVMAATPDLSSVPPHPRLYIGGMSDAAGYVDPTRLAELATSHPEQYELLKTSNAMSARALAARIAGDKQAMEAVADDILKTRRTRSSGLVELALAYDWIADSLSPERRARLSRFLGDLAEGRLGEAESRFNPWDNNPLRRSMGIGLIALAIAGDDARAQGLLQHAHPLMEEFMRITGDGLGDATGLADPMSPGSPVYGCGAYGGGWPEGHDYDRHGSRYAMIYFLGLRSATGVDVFTGSPFWKAKVPYHIYHMLPGGLTLPFHDDDNPDPHRYDREMMLVLAREFDDAHARWYLRHDNAQRDAASAMIEFLYDEPDAPEKDYADLPNAHYVPGIGLVMARSGWGPNDTYVGFQASDWYVYHQNNAAGVFAIYRNAPLAVKDGVYTGGVDDHYANYTIRTISYNGITVYDPDEFYGGPDAIPAPANDGGQRIQQWKMNPNTLDEWRAQARQSAGPIRDVVDWKGFETTDAYTYMAAEFGRAYYPGKVPFCSRQVVFIYPNWVIAFDRVTAGNESFVKKLHFHAPEEMNISGSQAVFTTREANKTATPGRLFVRSLLPAGATVEKVDAVAFYGGESHKGRDAYNFQLLCPSRLEITAPLEKTTCFLTAMYACDADVEAAPEAKVIEETADAVTVSLEGKWTLTFSKTGEVDWRMAQ